MPSHCSRLRVDHTDPVDMLASLTSAYLVWAIRFLCSALWVVRLGSNFRHTNDSYIRIILKQEMPAESKEAAKTNQ